MGQNSSGNFREMDRHISKGAWIFSMQDHGWKLSDCTAEALQVVGVKLKTSGFDPELGEVKEYVVLLC